MIPLVSKPGAVLAAFVLILTTLFARSFEERIAASGTADAQLSAIPMTLGNWTGLDSDRLSDRSEAILKLDHYLRRYYQTSDGDKVFLYVGYWKKQSGEHQAAKHSPLMCLPANGWKISQPEQVSLSTSDGPLDVRRIEATYQRSPHIFYYWFFSGEKTYVDESLALLQLIRQSIFEGRSDGGIVEVSVELDPHLSRQEAVNKAEAALKEFTVQFYPQLRAAITRTASDAAT